MGRRAQRIPSWPGVIHANKGRIHLRRPSCDILTIRLRQSGGPYIPDGRPTGSNLFHPSRGPLVAILPLGTAGLNAYAGTSKTRATSPGKRILTVRAHSFTCRTHT